MSSAIPLITLAALAVGAAAASWPSKWDDEARVLDGPTAVVGNGTARLFVERGSDGKPSAIGIALSEGALAGLSTHMNSTSRCFDKNGDGTLAHGECLGDDQVNLELPAGTEKLGLPFRWAMVNWNPEGHMHPAPPVWSAAHFDFHFYIATRATIDAIRPGPCAEIIDCEDFKRASMPLPVDQVPEGHIDVGAAVAAMGNHLVDSKDPELADPSLGFSSTFIYGTYDGRMIFLEPMVSHAFLASKPDRCTPVRWAKTVAETGYYPTRYCVRYDVTAKEYRVSLEGLTYRAAVN